MIFDSIAEALRKGEKVTLPIGTFEVLEHTRPPTRGWYGNEALVLIEG